MNKQFTVYHVYIKPSHTGVIPLRRAGVIPLREIAEFWRKDRLRDWARELITPEYFQVIASTAMMDRDGNAIRLSSPEPELYSLADFL